MYLVGLPNSMNIGSVNSIREYVSDATLGNWSKTFLLFCDNVYAMEQASSRNYILSLSYVLEAF